MAVRIGDTLKQINNADFPIVEAMDVAFESGDTLQELYDSGALSGGGGASYITLSQEEYDVLSDEEKVNGSEYRTYDTGHIYKLGIEYGKDGVQISDNETVEDKTWSSQKTSDEIAKVETELAGLKRRYNSIEELNTIKKKSLVLVDGEDNTQKVLDALDVGEVLSDYFANYGDKSRFGINASLGTYFIITFEKNDNGYAKVIANSVTSNTVLVRYHNFNELSAWTELATMDKVVQCVENKKPDAKTVSFELNSDSWNCGTIYGNTNNGGNFKYDYYVTYLGNNIELVKQDVYGSQGSITASLSGTTLTLTASGNTTIKTVTIIKC